MAVIPNISKQYKATLYNLDTNTFEEVLIEGVSLSQAYAWAEMWCGKNQQVESVELYK